MQKKRGFSLLELIAVTGIVALLAAISIPNFARMRSNMDFDAEIKTIFDQLLEVRMNALTGKMCDGVASDKWIFRFDGDTSILSCNKTVDGNTETVEIQSYNALWHQTYAIELDGTPLGSDEAEVQIEFLPGTAQALIPFPSGESQSTNAKISLMHSTGAEKTICFNRIVGIPEVFDGDQICPPEE